MWAKLAQRADAASYRPSRALRDYVAGGCGDCECGASAARVLPDGGADACDGPDCAVLPDCGGVLPAADERVDALLPLRGGT